MTRMPTLNFNLDHDEEGGFNNNHSHSPPHRRHGASFADGTLSQQHSLSTGQLGGGSGFGEETPKSRGGTANSLATPSRSSRNRKRLAAVDAFQQQGHHGRGGSPTGQDEDSGE